MSMIPHCDGCGAQLSLRPGGSDENDDHPLRRIHGERTDASHVDDLPATGQDFDWCGKCAVVAFAAVRDANAALQPGRELRGARRSLSLPSLP